MNSRQYHFPVTCRRHPPDFPQHILPETAAHPPSGVRNDTIAAKLVAAVLNLHIGPGVLRRLFKLHLLIFPGMAYIYDRAAVQRFAAHWFCPERLAFQIFLQNPDHVFLPVIPDGQVNAGVPKRFLLARLHIAAHGHHQRPGIQCSGPVQHLPALAVRNICHRAGVDNIDIGLFLKGDHIVPLLL